MQIPANSGWLPLCTLPAHGKVLLAKYAPTNWQYWPSAVVLTEWDTSQTRAAKIKYAVAWMYWPDEPTVDLRISVD